MADFFSNFTKDFTLFAAHEKPAVCLPRLKSKSADWAVIERQDENFGALYYVLEKSVFAELLRDHEEDFDESLTTILNLHEPDANVVIGLDGHVVFPGLQPQDLGAASGVQPTGRFSDIVVLLDRDQPLGLLTPKSSLGELSKPIMPFNIDLGKTTLARDICGTRQTGASGFEGIKPPSDVGTADQPLPEPGAEGVDVTLGAECQQYLTVGMAAGLTVTLAAGMVTLAGEQTHVKLSPTDEVVVRLSLSSNLRLTTGNLSNKVKVLTPEAERVLYYEVTGLAAGPARITVRLFQPGHSAEQVGYLTINPTVTITPVTTGEVLTPVAAAYPPSGCPPPDCTLFIDEEGSGNNVRVTFRITTASPPYPADVNYEGYELGARDLKIDPAVYFQQRFAMIEGQPFCSDSDVLAVQYTLRQEGGKLHQELLSAELRQELQERGHLISSIQIKSDGHHVPWEMILLPALQKEGKSFPAQFLAERYQVTRWTEGWSPPPTIQLNRFVYIAPRYAADQALVHAKDEVQFIESLRPRGVVPERVTALPLPIFDAIDNKPFDVLHFVGHAAQDTEKLSYSTLELETETRTNGGVQRLVPHSLEPVHVENKQVQWGARRPLVFFNACQTGRTDVGLVRPGGWARALLNSKAGVFIGTLWSVRDSAAQLFAKTFYESLLAKQTVGSSALAARRTVAEKLKDPSWLAYVVYAHPNTRAAVGP